MCKHWICNKELKIWIEINTLKLKKIYGRFLGFVSDNILHRGVQVLPSSEFEVPVIYWARRTLYLWVEASACGHTCWNSYSSKYSVALECYGQVFSLLLEWKTCGFIFYGVALDETTACLIIISPICNHIRAWRITVFRFASVIIALNLCVLSAS